MQRACQPEPAERAPECTTPAISRPKTGRAVGCALDPGASGAIYYQLSSLQFHEARGCGVDYFVPLSTGTYALRKVSSSRNIVTRADSALS